MVPAKSAATIPELPPANPKNFTAASPKPETVDAFLHQMWGYDHNRTWRVAGVQTTAAAGVSRVTVWVLEKVPGAQIQSMVFLATPDGNHAIEGTNIIPFGAAPFAANRELFRTGANGPFRGPATKAFEIVEFIDLQCPHCKEAQEIIDKLAKDFPKAHIATTLRHSDTDARRGPDGVPFERRLVSRLRLVLPEIVESVRVVRGPSRVIPKPAEEPQVPGAIDPCRATEASARHIAGGRRP